MSFVEEKFMRIVVDALPLLGDTGVTTYLYNLLKNLLFIDNLNEYLLHFRLGPRFFRKVNLELSGNYRIKKTYIPNTFLEKIWTFSNLNFYGDIFFHNPDLYFSTFYFIPVLKNPVVSVFYDIIPFKIKGYEHHRKMLDIRLRNVISRSKYIISISENSKKDLCDFYGIRGDNIKTIYLAADNIYKPLDKNAVRKYIYDKYKINFKYILYVGNMGIHKNVETLVKAYKLLKDKKKIEEKLILCGKEKWSENVRKLVSELKLNDEVRFLNYIPKNDLPYIYNGSELFVYISLYEGFGLPVLEAMSCGVPVITSNVSSLPEVGGNACIYVDPLNTEMVAVSIEKILNDENLKRELSFKSLERSKNFSWGKTAKETLSVFEMAVK